MELEVMSAVAPILGAIPWIASGLGSLFSLFGGGGDDEKPRTSQDTIADVQALLAAFPQLRESMNMQMQDQRQQQPVLQAARQMGINLAPRSAFANMGRGTPDDLSNWANVQRPNLSAPQWNIPTVQKSNAPPGVQTAVTRPGAPTTLRPGVVPKKDSKGRTRVGPYDRD